MDTDTSTTLVSSMNHNMSSGSGGVTDVHEDWGSSDIGANDQLRLWGVKRIGHMWPI